MSKNKLQSHPQPANPHKDDIICTATYHRRDFDLTVIHTNPRDHDLVRSSTLEPDHPPSATLGQLGSLPLEILHEICSLLDIQSLFNFRQVNRQARQTVATVPSYRATITHALEALCAILRTKIASWFTLSDLYNVLCTRDCTVCGSFGGYIFLPVFMRCCYGCIKEDRLPPVIPLAEAQRRLKRGAAHIYNLIPVVSGQLGIYSWLEREWKKKLRIVAEDHVSGISEYQNPNNDKPKRIRANRSLDSIQRYMTSTALPWLDVESRKAENGVCCRGCEVALEDKLRTRFTIDDFTNRDKVYSREDFMEHFGRCREAKELWRLEREGGKLELPEFIRRGGVFKERYVESVDD